MRPPPFCTATRLRAAVLTKTYRRRFHVERCTTPWRDAGLVYTWEAAGAARFHSMPQVPAEDSHTTASKEERLTSLFDSCYPRLARYAYARLGNPTDAEDIAAEVFVRAFESLHSFTERGLSMEARLVRIARNLIVDRYRRDSRFPRSEDVEVESNGEDPITIAERRILMSDVRRAMQRLTPDQREVVRLRFFGGLSSRETAEVMGKKDGSIREMQRAALEKLRGLLG